MNKPLSEWTLKEVKEMCNTTLCDDCIFSYHDIDGICKITFNEYSYQQPSAWELEENE